MNGIRTRLLSLALAGCLAVGVTAPASAEVFQAAAVQPAGSVMDTLMDVPILGDLIRFFAGSGEEDTSETAATQEDAATSEQATSEQATAEQATPEDTDGRTLTLTADSWPESWMIGAISPKGRYPAGNPEAARTLTLNSPLWATVDAEGGSVQVSSREETNFGSLLADAMSYAAASSTVWQENTALYNLPLVAVVNGGRLLKTVPAGTTLDETSIAEYVEDSPLSLVVISGKKLNEILFTALRGMLDPEDENYGAFLQVSGLRFVYQKTDGDYQIREAWLAGPGGASPVDLTGETTQLALVLPSDLLTAYGLNAEAGYTDYFAQPESGAALLADTGGEDAVQTAEAPTLHTALLDLPKNCDSDTLTLLLERQGTAGRILPATADTYTVTLQTDGAATNCTVIVYVDGEQKQGRIDAQGVLTVEGLAPGSHTIRLVPGGTAWFVSSITGFAAQGGIAVSIGRLPEGTVIGPLPTATPTPAATAAPTPTPAPATQTVTAQGTPEPEAEATPTPTPAPVAPAATPTPAPARTPAPVDDPTAGTIIGVTPAPTMTPTPTPSPTPEPTLSPEQQQQAEEVQKLSSNLPLYVGIGVLVAGAAVVAVVMIRRRMEEKPAKRRTTYHGKKK